MTRTVMTLVLFPALSLCSCSASLSGGNPSAFAHASEARAGNETEQLWIPDDVRHDPAARASLMEQLRVQILQKTREVPETNRLVVREQLRRQLDRAGFDMQEASYILASLDDPRGPLPEPKQDVARQRGSGGGESSAKPTIDSP
jgi:hypothetical protein